MHYFHTPRWTPLDLDELADELRGIEDELNVYCDECGGDGEVEDVCPNCSGAGWDGASDQVCFQCDGTKVVTVTCGECKGEGTVEGDVDRERYAELKALDDELYGGLAGSDDRHAIPEHGFEDYAQDLAESIGAIDREATWPLNRIDWEAAADDLKMDYTSFEWEGTTYYVRSV